jgi:hypothetical protein
MMKKISGIGKLFAESGINTLGASGIGEIHKGSIGFGK